VKGAGAGALCMLCHNSRDGAKNDSVTTFPRSAYTVNGNPMAIGTIGNPHDSPAADVFSGNNGFFMTGSKSAKTGKHLTFLADTCVDCHVKINVGGLSLETKGPNHLFKVDTTICASCHAAAAADLTDPVNGVQATFDAMLAATPSGFSASIGNAAYQAIENFIGAATGNGNLTVKITGSSLGTGASAMLASVKLSQIASIEGPSPVWYHSTPTGVKGTSSLVIHFTDSSVNGGTPVIASLANITWTGNDQTGTPNVGMPVFHPAGLIRRAVWNNGMILNDGSHGVHNWSFEQDLIANTIAAMNAYVSSGALSGAPAP
jgi:hypothetical protein